MAVETPLISAGLRETSMKATSGSPVGRKLSAAGSSIQSR
jgi:hypothetical protein